MAIDYSKYEPAQVAAQTNAYLAQKRQEREARQAAIVPPPLPLPSAAPPSYIPSLQQQAEEQKPWIQNAFEMIGRPEAAVRGAITAEARGTNPLAGFLQGIQGEELPGYSESLGVPMAVEKLGSFVLDPLNLIPGGKIVSGGRAALKAVRGIEHAAPVLEAGAKWRYGVPEALEAGTRETPLEPLRQAITSIPVVGEKVARLVSPRLADRGSSIGAIMNAFDGAVENASQAAEIQIARATGGRALTSQVTDAGEIVLTDGRKVGAADVAENLRQYQNVLPPEDVQSLAQLTRLFRDVQTAGSPSGAPILGEYDALVKSVRDLYGDEVAESFNIPQQLNRGGRDLFPRYIVNDKTEDFRPAPTSGHRTGLNDRTFNMEQQGIEAGYRYAGPLEAAQMRLTDHAVQMANMEALVQLKPYIKAVGDAASHEQASRAWSTVPVKGVPRDSGLEEVAESGFLKGLWADPADAEKIRERFGRETAFREGAGTARLVGGFADFNALARTIQSSGDVSAWFLQNMVTLASNPARGMASIWVSLRGLLDPKYRSKLYASEDFQDVMSRAPGLLMGGTGGAGEAFEALGKKGGIGQGLLNAPVVKPLVERSAAAFALAGDFSRYMGAKALLPIAEREGKVAEMVDFLNHSTGTASMRQMGVNPTQRGLESWLMFAPRYGRGSLAVIGDLGNGSLAGKEAANALGSMLLFGLAGYRSLGQLIGQEPELDPRRASFLTYELAGQRVGIGTVFRSMLQTLARIEAQVEGKEEFNLNQMSMENPLVRIARSRLSPAGSTFADLISGETFIGTPLANINPLAYAGTKLAPFTLAGFFTEHGDLTNAENWPGALAGTAAEATGLRTFPKPRGDVQDDIAGEMFPGKKYNDLDRVQKAQVQTDARIKKLPVREGSNAALDRESGKVYEQYKTKLETLAGRVDSGGADALTTKQFRDELQKLQQERRVLSRDLESRYPDQVRKPTTKEAKAEDEYFRLLSEPDATGRVNYEAAETYLSGLDQGTQDYIKDGLRASTERLDKKAKALVQELYAAREKLEPYWDVFNTEMQKVGLLDAWQSASGPEREKLTQDRRYKLAERRVSIARDRMRIREPETDATLVRWAYVSKPIRERRR